MMRKSLLFSAILFWAVPWVTAQSDYEVPESPIALTAKVLDIFSKSCAECHDANSGKRVKGDFDHVMDLELQLEDEYYLFAGDPEGSENFLLMITDDEDALMPPPESDVHKPTPEEIEIVRAWIIAMGEHPLPPMEEVEAYKAAELAKLEAAGVEAIEAVPKKKPISIRKLFARTHPMVVHFPIGLLLMAAAVEFLGLIFRKQKAWASAVHWSVAISALSSPAAVVAGWILADIENYTINLHRWLGVATAVAAIVSWVLLVLADKKRSNKMMWAFRIVLIASAVLVSLAGHTGGELVYGKGYPFN
ncbi:MAG: hypothetical protein MK080_13030 [Opitutales bacterium]|nr:hypothetical protein [Opitutales bacterium]NRA27840.1 hypothetical protein [Opitutales bacterium]